MDLSPYLASVREGVKNAAALADDNTQQVAQRLGTAIDSSTRLALIQALSDAASTISADLAPASVDVRIVGGDPEFAVSVPSAPAEPVMITPTAEEPAEPEEPVIDEDEPVARISLRLPASVKTKVDEFADADGISTNAWLQRAIMDALNERRRPPHPPGPPGPPAGVFGPDGPLGPNGVFGPHGVFGPGGPFGPGKTRHREGRPGRSGPGGQNVQGWVQ
ncbi:hypothetical protein [Microlunatus speluncae]|uniref:hypothetical protein n=1 Tax=Microlunatus speluncae TaxID=2594267 RepID=UPI00126635E6|nr:hypothetical protein [Microlunatus speluncae]